ncbi:MAG: FecR domain-containing protein, partial [Pirellulaceae bacterium]|nr:FecR domain-containing protein [Pirellulaceae bacterium]
SYMVASIFMCLLLLGFWAYKLPSDRGSSIASSDNSRRSTTSGEASSSDRPAPVFVGRVTGIAGAKWSDEPNYIAPLGYRVALGRTYKLKSGLLEITYDSGAKVILEGPCSYEVDSTAGGYLALGKLTAKVASGEWRVASDNSRRLTASGNNTAMAQTPEAVSLRLLSESTNPRIHSPLATNPSSLIPHPSSFVIRTPTAVVTDLGTEFGVEVAENGDTLSYVFQGIVKVQGLAASVASGPAPMETILRVDESARVVRNAGGPRLVLGGTVGNIPRFVQKIPDQSMLSDQSFAIDGRVFQDDFDGTSIDAAKWSLVLKHDGSISVAEGASNVNSGSSLVKTLAWMYSTEPLEFGKVSTDWWLEIRFKIEGPLASSTFSAVRDWIVCAGGSGPVKNMSIRGFDIRAMQRGPVDGDAYDLGWYGWDGTNENRIPTAIARKLEKGRYYTAAIHRKPDQTVDIYLGGRLIANRQLIDAANPVVLLCGDKSVMVGGRQTTDYVKIGTPTENESTTQDENRKEESSMRQ